MLAAFLRFRFLLNSAGAACNMEDNDFPYPMLDFIGPYS
ncbi:hypothetical protein HMPREF9413_3992 [Paenibacillus sp. HGF7]|nr:hypothetical protein HMPREF9413_3992 [Paenibacillus sp. HGF7]